MTNNDTILAQIRARPGLTDAELVQRTGVRQHKQVNAVCNRLQARGLIRRQVGPTGPIVNIPVDVADSSDPSEPEGPARPPIVSSPSAALSDIAQLDPARTLLVIPRSVTKTRGGSSNNAAGLCSELPDPKPRSCTRLVSA
jgi:MarR family